MFVYVTKTRVMDGRFLLPLRTLNDFILYCAACAYLTEILYHKIAKRSNQIAVAGALKSVTDVLISNLYTKKK